MKALDPNRSLATAAISLALSIILIFWPEFVERVIITVLGTITLMTAAISLFMTLRLEYPNRLILAVEILAILLGISLIVFHDFFLSSLVLVFGTLLVIMGIIKLIDLFSTSKQIRISWAFFITPLLTTICGVILFMNPFETVRWMFIFFGIVLFAHSINTLISAYRFRKFANIN